MNRLESRGTRTMPTTATPAPAMSCFMGLRTGVVVAVTFQQVDDTPDAETSAQSDNEGLKNGDSLIEKCHKL